MLPAAHRLTDAVSFRDATRRGRRAAGATVVVHVLPGDDAGPCRVGFVVSKAVGDSVTRNRVKRRLRHLVRDHLEELPLGSMLVVRALPRAADARAQVLGRDLASALGRLGVAGAGVPA